MTPELVILWAVILGLTAGGLGGLLWLGRNLRRTGQMMQWVESDLRVLKSDIAALSACQAEALERDQSREQMLHSAEQRLNALDQRLRLVVRRQDEKLDNSEPGETSYGAAIRLAHQGANVDLLVNTFGIARGEAELIAALHHTAAPPVTQAN